MLTPDVARIIDANLNRAREAVRVMEDYARFVLDDPAGCAVLKRLRHDLADCVRQLPAGQLLTARDTPGDVGTTISTSSERERSGAKDVFVAAAKRLPEALRTIEEYAKTFDADLSSAVEALRYRAYDIEQRLACRSDRSARMAKVRLYVLVTESLCRSGWLETAAAAIDGGAGCIQLREKSFDDGELLARARQLVKLCRDRNVLAIVNDRPDIAALADADGVHLGRTDMSLADARRIVGPTRLVGLSTHNPDQLQDAIAQSPDYIAVGPMFPSTTKPQDHVPGPDLLKRAIEQTETPVVPIGGITSDNVGTLVTAGARCVCVCSSVIGAKEPSSAAEVVCSAMP